MQYDPTHVYSGPTNAPLATLADNFHFAVRAALRGQRLIGSSTRMSDQFMAEATPALAARGWDFTEQGLVAVEDEGRGLVIAPIIEPGYDGYDYIRNHLSCAMASLA